MFSTHPFLLYDKRGVWFKMFGNAFVAFPHIFSSQPLSKNAFHAHEVLCRRSDLGWRKRLQTALRTLALFVMSRLQSMLQYELLYPLSKKLLGKWSLLRLPLHPSPNQCTLFSFLSIFQKMFYLRLDSWNQSCQKRLMSYWLTTETTFIKIARRDCWRWYVRLISIPNKRPRQTRWATF